MHRIGSVRAECRQDVFDGSAARARTSRPSASRVRDAIAQRSDRFVEHHDVGMQLGCDPAVGPPVAGGNLAHRRGAGGKTFCAVHASRPTGRFRSHARRRATTCRIQSGSGIPGRPIGAVRSLNSKCVWAFTRPGRIATLPKSRIGDIGTSCPTATMPFAGNA